MILGLTNRKGLAMGNVKGCRGSLEERFWRKVNKTETCWIWIGAKCSNGYGTFGTELITKGKMRVDRAHRVAWELLRGPIPDGMVLDHDNQQFGCGNPACVNPDHLQLVTRGVNKQRGRGTYANNTSGYRGVTWSQPNRKWTVRVGHNGKEHYGGRFTDLAEAVAVRDLLQTKLYGEVMRDEAI